MSFAIGNLAKFSKTLARKIMHNDRIDLSHYFLGNLQLDNGHRIDYWYNLDLLKSASSPGKNPFSMQEGCHQPEAVLVPTQVVRNALLA